MDSFFDVLAAMIDLCISSWWGIVGAILGLAAAAGAWHLVAEDVQAPAAAAAYLFVFILCLIVGGQSKGQGD